MASISTVMIAILSYASYVMKLLINGHMVSVLGFLYKSDMAFLRLCALFRRAPPTSPVAVSRASDTPSQSH
eukprot:scaffold156550_cov23-Prasinocladus_malaysianus.AAC.1